MAYYQRQFLSDHEDALPTSTVEKIKARRAFLNSCCPRTVEIQAPIADPFASRGHPNPKGLGDAEAFSREGSWGQCSVLFSSLEESFAAFQSGKAPYGGGCYGITLTPEADAVCRKMAALHGGNGAIICPSGLAAITTVLSAFAPKAILLPDNVYGPVPRFLARRPDIKSWRYPAAASADEVDAALNEAFALFAPADIMMYIEAPGSGTLEIPDIDGIIALSKKHGLRSVIDNTWASHVRYKPLLHGIDICIQATTKYEGGYGDTPSGVVIARTEADLEELVDELESSGNGAVAPTTCARLFRRIDSAEERMNKQYESALQLCRWFQKQPFVSEVLNPALEKSPYHERFERYFGKGNGLFSVVFKADLPHEKVDAFANTLNLFWVAASWGGHVSLVFPVPGKRAFSSIPENILRFHAGLEDPQDLLRDLDQAAHAVFGI